MFDFNHFIVGARYHGSECAPSCSLRYAPQQRVAPRMQRVTVCVCVCVCVRARACARARARVRVRACVRMHVRVCTSARSRVWSSG